MTTSRQYSSPFIVQIASDKPGEHCDIYPHGSIHEVKRCNDGHLWLTKKIDSIPRKFKIRILDEKPATKKCPMCEREYPTDWKFGILEKNEVCNRCVERHTQFNRNA